MPTLSQELTSLISLLENRIPANPQAPANVRRVDRLAGQLKDYFKALEQAFVSGPRQAFVEKGLGGGHYDTSVYVILFGCRFICH